MPDLSDFIMVVGPRWAGKSFAAGVLHYLGLQMSSGGYEPRKIGSFDYYPFEDEKNPIAYTMGPHAREELDKYLAARRRKAAGRPCGVKFQNVKLLALEGVPEGCKLVYCYRPFRETLPARITPERLEQRAAWVGFLDMIIRPEDLVLDFHDDIRGAGRSDCVARLAAFAGVDVTDAAFDFAAILPKHGGP